MHKTGVALTLALGLAALLVTAAACGDDEKGATATPTAPAAATPTAAAGAQSEVAVTLVEYQVQPQPTSVPAGAVTFNITNQGGTEHELVVIKTDLEPDALPTEADGTASEEAPGATIIDEAEDIAAGASTTLTVNLEAGQYILLWNILQETDAGTTISHYAQGMTVAFTVTQ